MHEWNFQQNKLMAIVLFGLILMQLFGIFLSCCLADAIRKEYTPV